MSWWPRLALCAAALALAACGFQLRGSFKVPDELVPIYISADRGSAVARELRYLLERNGMEIAGSRAAAASEIEILREKRERRVLTVSAQTADVDEFELRYTTDWLLRDTGEARRPLTNLETIERLRDYVYDQDAVLAKQSEEAQLVERMQQDTALQILYRMQSWQPAQAPEPADVETQLQLLRQK